MPASNARALEKARGLDADMLIIDLEDSVPDDGKAEARIAAVREAKAGFPGKLLAIRINATDSPHVDDDIAAVCGRASRLFRPAQSGIRTRGLIGSPNPLANL